MLIKRFFKTGYQIEQLIENKIRGLSHFLDILQSDADKCLRAKSSDSQDANLTGLETRELILQRSKALNDKARQKNADLQSDVDGCLATSPAVDNDDMLSESEIAQLISQRTTARNSKNWGEGDRIRDLLDHRGVVLEDAPQETTWRRK